MRTILLAIKKPRKKIHLPEVVVSKDNYGAILFTWHAVVCVFCVTISNFNVPLSNNATNVTETYLEPLQYVYYIQGEQSICNFMCCLVLSCLGSEHVLFGVYVQTIILGN